MPADASLEELLQAIRTDGAERVAQRYKHDVLPRRLLIDLYSKHAELEVLRFLALYPTVPSQILEDLTASCDDPSVQAAAAANPRCSQLMLVRMARHGGSAVRKALAAHRQLSPKVVGDLLRDSNLQVRIALASNPSIPSNFQQMLLADEAPAVRAALATATKLPEELLAALADDPSAVVRAVAIARSKASSTLLSQWAAGESIDVQRLLLTRKKLPTDALNALSVSNDPRVLDAVDLQLEPTPQVLLERAMSECDAVRIHTASQAHLPEEIQQRLANDPLPDVRTALAKNPNLSPSIALRIATSRERDACIALAQNNHLSAATLRELCHHELDEVRLQLAYRDDLAPEQIDWLVNQHDDLNIIGHLALRGVVYTQTHRERCEQLLEQKAPAMRRFAAASHHLDADQKKRLMADPAPSVRQALGENQSLNRAERTPFFKDE